MKRSLTIVCTVLCLLAYVAPTWAQATTEGKQFWVAMPLANAPGGSISGFEPFIAISAKKACTVIVSNPSQNWTDQPRTVQADSWLIINNIPQQYWYNTGWDANSASEIANGDNKGILITATEEVSCYAAMRMEYSYDASNILPTPTLQSEYIIQDYPPYNSQGESHALFVVLATEDNTVVDIKPTTTTIKGKPANQSFSITLNKGRTYMVIGNDKQSFSGTTVKARDGKKIAVFQGADFTQIPGGKSARDCLYEQAMPIDYWGTEFVVTRSEERDANRVRITAQEDGTQIYIDGFEVNMINAGETFEFEMSENLASTTMQSAITGAGRTVPPIYTGEAHYIQTSCPCAVYSYDVSSDYRFSSSTKIGDPSMVWIAPLQQRINKITFGACGTSGTTGHTNRHFVNVVCLTSDVPNFKLSSNLRPNIPNITFQPVPSNPAYSYARIFLVDTDKDQDKIYTMSNKQGFIAHVYGSGNNESYAYSAGSAAVKRGIAVEGKTYTDGLLDTETSYCVAEPVAFDAQVGTDIIDKVDWDFGDGVTENNGTPQFSHTYDVPGWYDVIARVYAHKECPETTYPAEDVHFSFYVARPKTIHAKPGHICLEEGEQMPAKAYQENGRWYAVDTTKYDCDSIVIRVVEYGRATSGYDTIRAEETCTYHGHTYTQSGDYDITLPGANLSGCDSTIHLHLTIVTCLDMAVSNKAGEHHVCPGETFYVPYTITKGEISTARLVCPALRIDTLLMGYNAAASDQFELPTDDMLPGEYKAEIRVYDDYCVKDLIFPLTLQVYYPSDIIAYKYGNVLAVFTNSDYNGGYTFSGYQWFYNGDLIPDATTSVYHYTLPSGEVHMPSGEYYVVLTRNDGVVLPSCPISIDDSSEPYKGSNAPAYAPEAEKVMVGNRLCIRVGNTIYDMYGNEIR